MNTLKNTIISIAMDSVKKVKILSPNSNVWSVIHDIINSGQEDAFLVCDLSDVVRKYENWIQKLPRVKPYYGK